MDKCMLTLYSILVAIVMKPFINLQVNIYAFRHRK